MGQSLTKDKKMRRVSLLVSHVSGTRNQGYYERNWESLCSAIDSKMTDDDDIYISIYHEQK